MGKETRVLSSRSLRTPLDLPPTLEFRPTFDLRLKLDLRPKGRAPYRTPRIQRIARGTRLGAVGGCEATERIAATPIPTPIWQGRDAVRIRTMWPRQVGMTRRKT